jgi:hypothetical protein
MRTSPKIAKRSICRYNGTNRLYGLWKFGGYTEAGFTKGKIILYRYGRIIIYYVLFLNRLPDVEAPEGRRLFHILSGFKPDKNTGTASGTLKVPGRQQER